MMLVRVVADAVAVKLVAGFASFCDCWLHCASF